MDEISFGGEKYIASKKAAKMVSYTNDYVGQLCREGKVNCRRIGREWYVNERSLLEHKQENQSKNKKNSVSSKIEKQAMSSSKASALDAAGDLYYKKDSGPLNPAPAKNTEEPQKQNPKDSHSGNKVGINKSTAKTLTNTSGAIDMQPAPVTTRKKEVADGGEKKRGKQPTKKSSSERGSNKTTGKTSNKEFTRSKKKVNNSGPARKRTRKKKSHRKTAKILLATFLTILLLFVLFLLFGGLITSKVEYKANGEASSGSLFPAKKALC